MLNVLFVTVLTAVVIASVAVYHFLIFPLFISPLARIPSAHPSAPISWLWIYYVRYISQENRTIRAAHAKHGSIVRLSPTEISVNSVDRLRTIYAGGFEKDDWYEFFTNYDGTHVMFSTTRSRPHSVRKRILSNIYSKSFVQSSSSLSAISRSLIHQRLLPKLHASHGLEVNVHLLFNSIALDFVTAYQFGLCNGSNFVEDEATAERWFELYHSRRAYTYWAQEFPRLTSFVSNIGINLVPGWVSEVNRELEDWCLQLCDAADQQIHDEKALEIGRIHPENIPVVYRQLKTSMDDNTSHNSTTNRISAASEMFDHLAAGHETSAIALTFLFYELARLPTLQQELRAELQTLTPPLTLTSATTLPPPKSLDVLPLLNAILMETLRLHAPIPGPQPRLVPSSGTTLGPYFIPPGTRVSASAHSLHRDPTVFRDPETWQPYRWLVGADDTDADAARRAEQSRWFWAFGSGGRMCVGSNFAMQEMKLIVAAIVANFDVFRVGEARLEQEDAYTAQPVGRKLVLRFERADRSG